MPQTCGKQAENRMYTDVSVPTRGEAAAAEMGMACCLLVCRDDNIASIRTVECAAGR